MRDKKAAEATKAQVCEMIFPLKEKKNPQS